MVEITGTIAVTAAIAIAAAFITQAVKQALPKQYHRYIPLPLALILVGLGVLLAYLKAEDMVAGGVGGFVAAAWAVYGYEFVHSVLKGGSRNAD